MVSDIQKLKKLLTEIVTTYVEHIIHMRTIQHKLERIVKDLKKDTDKTDLLQTLKKIHNL